MATLDRAPFPYARNDHPNFRTAAESYIQHGGEARYLAPICAYFGDTPIEQLTPFDFKQMALAILPSHSGATRNRQALTPAKAVMFHAYERGWAPLMRISAFKAEPPKRKSPASTVWLQLFVRQCDGDGLDHLAALVLFMSQTGARVSEAVRLCWPEVDFPGRRVVLLKTKTGKNSMRFLTDALVQRLRILAANALPGDRVFRYTSRYSVNERIAAVCARAGISYKSSHACGRHSFATNAMIMGIDIATAMQAGDWRSSRVFIETYVHTPNAGRNLADRFNATIFDPAI